MEFHLNELNKAVSKILEFANREKTICFYGQMGAGKTTLIKELVNALGATDHGSSPTFGLVNEYHDKNGNLLAYHFDFYRIENEEQAMDIGLEDYLSSNVWLFIEWPEKIKSLLPNNAVSVYLHFIDENTRSIEFSTE
ncbi:tRNA (adenosine(37)-N6)-threonylcarbamoyltransferase complex ATPase subunit type 1 TsaE [Flagellimonas pacifica]|uniref:tRNA threonylcarbamoyladenosine biosynthesis protein TsaE n=1 Tax=Flagellimonas pacifica TaxID=1247520 RepID=A0A285MVL8_9FLAO|nr:tRNA (adenosine(37)-N6)-threonylcarbamoyltransferase complex ATPase subunit type 1 TsaE [Allomuricauda parva]SNY99846.1 tRNA threonylcarbamoyladenosine biosynthesis protein TsaE [Allomuricauda parva]